MTCESMRLDRRIRFTLLAFLFIVSSATGRSASAAEDPIEFNRDIRPILSDNCFFCHGPDKHERQAEMPKKLEEIVRGVTGTFGATFDFTYIHGAPVTANEPAMTDLMRETAGIKIHLLNAPSPTYLGESSCIVKLIIVKSMGKWHQNGRPTKNRKL